VRFPALGEMRKFLAAATGAVGQLVTFGLLSGQVENVVSGVLAAATALVVYLVENDKPIEDLIGPIAPPYGVGIDPAAKPNTFTDCRAEDPEGHAGRHRA
jgi:hypothetical protein